MVSLYSIQDGYGGQRLLRCCFDLKLVLMLPGNLTVSLFVMAEKEGGW